MYQYIEKIKKNDSVRIIFNYQIKTKTKTKTKTTFVMANPTKIDVNHDYMALIYEHVIKKETKKNIRDVIRDKFIEFKETDEYKNEDIDSLEWSMNYVEKDMDKDAINELCNDFGQLNILRLLPKLANVHCFYSYDDFVEDSGDLIEEFLMSYIIEEFIIADLK